jgi:hypothetical protein
MLNIISSASETELRFISNLDYGQDNEKHFSALQSLLRDPECRFVPGEYWFPYEVIELGSHTLQPGHEREFAICTLLVLHAVRTGFDNSTDLSEKWADCEADYARLSPELSASILDAYTQVGF